MTAPITWRPVEHKGYYAEYETQLDISSRYLQELGDDEPSLRVELNVPHGLYRVRLTIERERV